MKPKQMTTPTKQRDIRRSWHLIDVEGKHVGRVATTIAAFLIGKTKPYYVPFLDCGDHVIVVNAAKVTVTGNKAKQKTYARYSGYPSGLKVKSFRDVLRENPGRIMTEAVAGMLPKNKLRPRMLRRLHVFPDAKHPYEGNIKKDKTKEEVS